MSNIIPLRPLKASNAKHETDIEFAEDQGLVRVTLDMAHKGQHEMGISFWMTEQQEKWLLDWLRARERR